MITIDGSFGEGGGQILRSALGLSMFTGQAVEITNIRAGRRKPGLLRQHYTAVKAAAEISNAEVEGHEMGSQHLVFKPGKVTHGDYHFSIGSAGSAMLVFQTILPALLHADGMSTVTIEGGTHNDMSPPFDFVAQSFIPQLRRMGVEIDVELVKHGFYPAGGGKIKVTVQSVKKWKPISFMKQRSEAKLSVIGLYANISPRIAEEEVHEIGEAFDIPQERQTVKEVRSIGPGNAVMLECEYDGIKEVITGFGAMGKSRKKVAKGVIKEAKKLLLSWAPVGEHLADQLLIPMALAGGGEFRTVKPTDHTITNIEVIKRFLNVEITCAKEDARTWLITLAE